VPVEQLPEVRFAQPTVDVRADLDAERVGHRRRPPERAREEDLTEATGADEALDTVAETGLGAADDLSGDKQVPDGASR
jgi:hypothetical protein